MSREFWEAVERIAKEVASWPEWKQKGSAVSPARYEDIPASYEDAPNSCQPIAAQQR